MSDVHQHITEICRERAILFFQAGLVKSQVRRSGLISKADELSELLLTAISKLPDRTPPRPSVLLSKSHPPLFLVSVRGATARYVSAAKYRKTALSLSLETPLARLQREDDTLLDIQQEEVLELSGRRGGRSTKARKARQEDVDAMAQMIDEWLSVHAPELPALLS